MRTVGAPNMPGMTGGGGRTGGVKGGVGPSEV
jgi:hypothetical protein